MQQYRYQQMAKKRDAVKDGMRQDKEVKRLKIVAKDLK